jgi:hypothetical protein
MTRPARALERWQGGAHDGGRADQVDRDDAVPRLRGDVEDVAAGVGARRGDDRVEAAVLLHDRAHRRLRLARVREIDWWNAQPFDGGWRSSTDRRAALRLDRSDDRRAQPDAPPVISTVPRAHPARTSILSRSRWRSGATSIRRVVERPAT